MKILDQPILKGSPEPGHDPKNVLTLKDFILLLKEEEDYWSPEQSNTKLMISRLRKIFYDKWGWNSELIRGAAQIESRFITVLKDSPIEHGKEAPRYKNLVYSPVYRAVTYTDQDRIFGNTRVGQVPFIYQHDHQDVLLPEGYFCDIAHILAGLDAINNKQVVSPLPNFLSFLDKLVPNVDSNVDVVTWLGDIASSSADFLFDYLKNKNNSIIEQEEQEVVDIDASGSDLLGDIEPYVIAQHYDVSSSNGKRFTEIIEDYYYGNNSYRSNRFSTFSKAIGLEGWNGKAFSNEQQWLKYYHDELRNCVCFVAYSQNEKSLEKIILPVKIWFNCYQSPLKLDLLLNIFLKVLKQNVESEKYN